MRIQNAFRLALVGTLGVGAGLLILSAVASLSTILTYVGVALFLALGLEPAISGLERRGLPVGPRSCWWSSAWPRSWRRCC